VTADLVSLLVAAVFVVIAAFLVAGETAIGRVSRARVDELAHGGVRGAATLRPLLDDRARYVNVLLFLHMFLFVAAIVLVTRAFLDMLTGPTWWRTLVNASCWKASTPCSRRTRSARRASGSRTA